MQSKGRVVESHPNAQRVTLSDDQDEVEFEDDVKVESHGSSRDGCKDSPRDESQRENSSENGWMTLLSRQFRDSFENYILKSVRGVQEEYRKVSLGRDEANKAISTQHFSSYESQPC